MSSTFFASCLLLALAAAQDGLVVTVGEEGAHRKLSSSPGERCADMTFNGLAEGSIISSLSVGNGIEGKPIPGEVEVYGLRKNEKRNKLNNQGKLERYIARRPGRNRAMIFDSACGNANLVTSKNPFGCTGNDGDLASGPGTPAPKELFEVMIVTEDGNKNDPDDAIGGALLYDFSGFGKDGVSMNAGTVSITDINILDSEEGGNIYCRDKDFKKIANDNGVKNFAIPNRHNGGGDGLLNVINMDVTGCSLLVVDFKGSGAVDLTEICVPLAMAGDPMVVGPTGNKTQFWMPLGKFYPVLTTAEGTEVFLRAFGKPGTHSQWIDGVIIKENGVIVADVVVEHDEEERRDDFLDFLKVKVDGKQKHHPGVHASSLGSTKLDFAKHDFPILDKMGDSITITTKGLKLSMFTMPARKFKDEKEAAKYTHIDFKILSIDEPTKCTGFLSDLLFGTDTAEPELKAAWLTKPSPYDESDVIETPESFANETNVIYS